MQKLAAALALIAFTSFAHAEDSACMAAAKAKKAQWRRLQTSFVKRCETDAKAKCETAATEKKLAGAAKNSNVKKCVRGRLGLRRSRCGRRIKTLVR